MDTRGAVSDLPAIQTKDVGFGVFGNHSTTDGPTPAYGQNMFKNQHVTFSSSSTEKKWEYKPVKYWPTAGHIDFLAYAPHDDKQVLNNNKYLDFKVNSDVTKQIDLLWDHTENKTKASGKVNFTFKHALARIGYSVKSKTDYDQTTITVKSIKLVGDLADENIKAFYTKGTIDLSKDNNDANELWTNTDGLKQNFDWFSGNQELSTEYKPDNYLFVIPQDFSSTVNNLYVVVEYTVTTGTSVITNTVSHEITKDFKQGTAYMINLTIGLTPIEFEATVNSWGLDNNEDIDLN